MPPFPVRSQTEIFVRKLVTGSIEDEEHLEEARRRLRRINAMRGEIKSSDAPDRDQKLSSLDRWHELLRRRIAEKEGGIVVDAPIKLTKGGGVKTTLGEQLARELATREIRDGDELEQVRKRIQADIQQVASLQKQIADREALQDEQKVASLRAELDKVKSRLQLLRDRRDAYRR
jgi:hypothetical protein